MRFVTLQFTSFFDQYQIFHVYVNFTLKLHLKPNAQWAYDNCFNTWFREKYLVEGKKYPEGYVPCEELHTKYQACVLKAIQEQELDVR